MKRKFLKTFESFESEEYLEEIYDELLDIYNDKGVSGLAEDEIDYLKSGGKTKIPDRFLKRKYQEEYDKAASGEDDIVTSCGYNFKKQKKD